MADANTVTINSRRYLGNKYRLLDFIRGVVRDNCRNVAVFADLFAGTGSVASAFAPDCTVITNDILYCNYITNYAWLSSERYSRRRVKEYVERFNSLDGTEENYMTRNFADTYFSAADCSRIGSIRATIEEDFAARLINGRERALLITSLLYAMDRIAKTCGHYDAYRRGASFDERLELRVPATMTGMSRRNRFYNDDIAAIAPRVRADVVYLDPPYNSRQYCDTYHLLENVARWEQPDVSGVARKMDRTGLKSRFCTREAPQAFAELVNTLDTRYILLSYNNMMAKGNARSNARITDAEIIEALSQRGPVATFIRNYKPFSAGKSAISDNEERLFLCTCQQ